MLPREPDRAKVSSSAFNLLSLVTVFHNYDSLPVEPAEPAVHRVRAPTFLVLQQKLFCSLASV